ncbi:MAG: NCS2 family permease [Peptoniphilaceae bacterium]|uniref:NCS2 family permease n=1 Tax=Parvimonas sp. TaxID=1944660 RepID=UPI0025D061FB|nr:NCS2 family permease [Parvimonas sp.]MCI5997922.1 NCS2 family permease [Parvimonas sp.]MDD7764235.1 NCS2 family permease [Peptoniphilaceae bacterium]MDY3050441.1 NCS2 family permease [Parvimonas sp.]
MSTFLEKFFKLKEHKTNVKTEILAGFTTFMTMAYILVVNPDILSKTGMDKGAVFTTTAIASFFATVIMGLYANYPFALAPGMGLNAYFAYTIVIGKGYSWQFALTAVLLEGLIFIVLTFTKVREIIVNAIPYSLKQAVSAGIGIFIAFLGLYQAGLVKTGEGIPLDLGVITSASSLATIFGIIITIWLLVKKVPGAILIGMVLTTIVCIVSGVSNAPKSFIGMPSSIAPIFMKFDFSKVVSLDMVVALFAFLFVDLFDTVGTLVGVASKADMLDEKGNLPKARQALFADSLGTTVGAMLGTSTVTTFVESAAGVAEGGRTGLTAIVTALLFLLALIFEPIFSIIPTYATSSALIVVGLFMITGIKKINFEDYTESLPAFLTIIMMPLSYSIANGIVFGIVSYAAIKLITGRRKEVSLVVFILAGLFVLKFVAEALL